MDPEQRLGSGEEGSPQSFDNLINHPWFVYTKNGHKK